MWKSRSYLEVIQEKDGRKRMKMREKAHSRNLSDKISTWCFYPEEQELGEKEWKVKVHPLHPLYHQMYWALYLAYQGSDLPVQIPGTSTYVIGHLTLISNVPQQN